jgi:hypothetical protein
MNKPHCCDKCKCQGMPAEVVDGLINVACDFHDGDCHDVGCNCHKHNLSTPLEQTLPEGQHFRTDEHDNGEECTNCVEKEITPSYLKSEQTETKDFYYPSPLSRQFTCSCNCHCHINHPENVDCLCIKNCEHCSTKDISDKDCCNSCTQITATTNNGVFCRDVECKCHAISDEVMSGPEVVKLDIEAGKKAFLGQEWEERLQEFEDKGFITCPVKDCGDASCGAESIRRFISAELDKARKESYQKGLKEGAEEGFDLSEALRKENQ